MRLHMHIRVRPHWQFVAYRQVESTVGNTTADIWIHIDSNVWRYVCYDVGQHVSIKRQLGADWQLSLLVWVCVCLPTYLHNITSFTLGLPTYRPTVLQTCLQQFVVEQLNNLLPNMFVSMLPTCFVTSVDTPLLCLRIIFHKSSVSKVMPIHSFSMEY